MGIDFKHFNTELETLYLKYDGTNDVLDVGWYEKCILANRQSVGLQFPRRTPVNYDGGSYCARLKYDF